MFRLMQRARCAFAAANFVMDQARFPPIPVNGNGAPVAIDINVAGDVSISAIDAPAMTARATGAGDAGAIHLQADNVSAQVTTEDFTFALIDTHTSGSGRAGDVEIATTTLTAQIAPIGGYLIDSGTFAEGNGADVTVTAREIQLEHAFINSGDFRAINAGLPIDAITGTGGDIILSADTISLNLSFLASQMFQGQGGDISLRGNDITLKGFSGIVTSGLFGSGAVRIDAHQVTMTVGSQIEVLTVFAPGKDVVINTGGLDLSDGSIVRTQTGGSGSAGNIIVTATDHVTFTDPLDLGEGAFIRPSGLYSNALATPFEQGGNAGSIAITTPRLEMTGGARLDTTTQTSGHGGNVTIVAADSVMILGERTEPPAEDPFAVGSNLAGGIFTRTIGAAESCSGACGSAGNISITTGSLTLGSGSVIDSSTTSSGGGGAITIQAANQFALSGTLADGSPVGIFSRTIGTEPDAGAGGNISLTAGQSVTISDGASVSASSTGPGNAGNILVKANDITLNGGGTITAASTGAGNAGTVMIQVLIVRQFLSC